MAYIKVNIAQLEATARMIDEHISYVERTVTAQDVDTAELMQAWEGRDADEFKSYIQGISGDCSVLKAYKKSLSSYAEFLRSAATIYKSAMIDAYNEANSCAK